MEKKITIDQLKNYLGTGLKLKIWPWYENHYPELWCSHLEEYESSDEIRNIKPLCYRLSDLDKFIPELGFVPIDELQKIYPTGIDTLKGIDYVKESGKWMLNTRRDGEVAINIMWTIYQKLFQWHFWPFGDEYFEAGLVIDKLKQ